MTAPDQAEFARLAAELTADLANLDALVGSLADWTKRDAAEPEILIPAALLHHVYTGIETMLSRLAVGLEGSEPTGPESHRRLLLLAGLEVKGIRPAWFSAQQLDTLRELLGFRHLFRHGYGAKYRPDRIRELAALAVGAWASLRASLARAIEMVEGLTAGGPSA